MNKKFLMALSFVFIGAAALFAQPPPPPFGPGGWGPHPPPPPGPGWGWHHPYHHGWYPGDSGLANAAAITSIVANGVSIMSNLSTPRTTTVIQPVPVAQPVVVQPVVRPVVQPVVQPVVYPTYYW